VKNSTREPLLASSWFDSNSWATRLK